MKNRDFREIQVSSTLLVVIFLLGVSVGKKQGAVSSPTQIVTQQIPEPVKEPPLKTAASDTESGGAPLSSAAGASQPPAGGASREPAPKEKAADKVPVEKPAAESKKAPAGTSGVLYYVQIAAFTDKTQAQALADKYKKQGYTTVVDPRPTSTKTWYRVRLGGYATREKAVDRLSKLNAATGKKTDVQIVHD